MADLTGYGSEMWCDENGLRTGRFVFGANTVIQALVRRYQTPEGQLQGVDDDDLEDSTYGYDLVGWIGETGLDNTPALLPNVLRAQGLKDDRVADVEAVVTIDKATPAEWRLLVDLRVTLHDETGVFPLTLAITSLGVQDITGA